MAFRILSIDGGGIRGVYPAHILKRIQEESGINFSEHFQLIVGTSTGSIIASALALDIPIKEVLEMYKSCGPQIFTKNLAGWGGLFRSRYGKTSLSQILAQKFGEQTLSNPKTRLIIPATDISNGGVHVFKSKYLEEFVRDKNVKIRDAVLASCSAPLYFDPTKVGNYLLADGGMWANNPALVALTEAITKLKQSPDEIKMLSIGTGRIKVDFPISTASSGNWGFLGKWKRKKLIDAIMNLQSISTENHVKLILKPENYLRLNFESHKDIPLDNINSIPDLETKADYTFTHEANAIKSFINN